MIKEINFSKQAVEKINQLVAKKPSGTFFRIAVKGGGCSGFKYDFSFDNKIDENDLLTLNGSTIAPAGLMSLGGGIPTPPIIIELTNSLNGEGQGEMTMERKYMSTSTGAIDTVLESGATTARGRQSWREIK